MNNLPDNWDPQPGYWTIEKAIRHLAFGQQEQLSMAPEMNQIEWLKLRYLRQQKARVAAIDLEVALNARECQASGCELPAALWAAPKAFIEGSVALEDRAPIERTVRAKRNKSRFRCSIDLEARYPTVGLPLALKDDAAGLVNITKLFVMVEVPEAQIRALKRRLDFERDSFNAPREKKMRAGRPGIPDRILEISRGRGIGHSKAIEEAKECCKIYKNESGEDLNPETVSRKISADRKARAAAS